MPWIQTAIFVVALACMWGAGFGAGQSIGAARAERAYRRRNRELDRLMEDSKRRQREFNEMLDEVREQRGLPPVRRETIH